MDSYRTVKKESSGEFIIKKSRFIGYVCPVKTAEEAMEFISKIKSKHWDATHNVYAYALREGGVRRYSDDGEPQGTAGIPTLDVIIKEDVTDVAVVVTRYFGGIMLGAGGLVRAYSQGSKTALESGGIITMALCSKAQVKCDYSFYGRLSSLIPESGAVLEDTVFEDDVTVKFRLPADKLPAFDAEVFDLSSGRFHAEETGREYAEI